MFVPVFSSMANNGILKVTVAPDSTCQQTAKPVTNSAGVKFQVAAVKTPHDVKAVAPRDVHPHWR